jgi:hypothetical protein
MSLKHILAIVLAVLVLFGGIPSLIGDARAGYNPFSHIFGIMFCSIAAYWLWVS